ncbi:MATE family efflux transporter [Mucilaginibacter psychrotolerans]|uniref:Multidrug-efflux transporter n=1 Tax=Mucilaginibacter psychrotolerans TaxID=1524096 RepID=A0A4Y8SKM9_9SPHI|nr:MATE family efflux transporter [Mucilaginibacter psychrotolerans]TFF39623.1 MATE family efflux transporter [Mucilaginibacter psychrotolerans]
MKTTYLKYKHYYKDSLRLAIPVVISQLGHTLVQVSDSVIVGHFAGTTALAAVSLVSSLFLVPLVIGIGISYGVTPLIAQNNGRGDYKECSKLLSNSLLLNIIAAVVLFAAIYFGVLAFIDKLHQSPEVVAQAKPFLFLLSLSLIPLMVFSTFKQFAEGLGFTKQAMMVSIWGNVLNICLGITFVKGLFGIPPMGIRGVGFSTLIDRSVMAIVMAFYVLRSPIFRKYLHDFTVRNVDRIRGLQILKIGAPVALQYTFEVSAFGAAAILIGMIGPIPQAAHQVAISLAAITYMMASGISSAAAIRSGNYFGSGDHHNLRLSAISNYHIVIVFMSCTAIIFTLFNHVLPYIYTTDRSVIAIAEQLLIVAAFFQLFDGTQVVGLGVLRGIGDVNIPTVITFVSYWVIGLPIGYLLGIHLGLGVTGVWYGLVCGLMSASVMLFLRFQVISKRNKLTVVID